ncbi:MAG: polysaccharide deacetylase family protein [Chitinophagaceae bacterium]
MLVYSSTISARLRYISDFIGQELTGKPFLLTTDKQEFLEYPGAKINYSESRFGQEKIWLQPHDLLFESDVHQQKIACFEEEGQKIFFRTAGDLPFDIFAASFYLLSRYEEYLPHEKDMYGRYAHENSLAFREIFLNIPLINTWLQWLSAKLPQQFPSFAIHHSPFTFLPTYDIDEAFSYKHKSWWRSTGGLIKDILKGNQENNSLRRKVTRGKLSDPFDSYKWMDALHEQYKLSPSYFFLLAGKTGKYDRNILPGEPALRQLVKEHAAKYETGVHPSWQSGDKPSLIREEIATLSSIAGKAVHASRQHFIRFNLPQTFRQLIEAGITDEYSMGYGSINGFRASVASPFYWYDLEKDAPTQLRLWPFCYMDANSFFEQKFSPLEALEEMRHYYKVVKKVNGTFISIWHNTFLGTDGLFAGWKDIYERFIQESST